ncbi:MAG: endo-1,4-beta-xylanase [Candidatus Poribacteria bacterium]
MTAREILAGREERIAQYRVGEAKVRVVDGDGEPLSGIPITVRQIKHDFKFGCNIFLWRDEDADWQMEYRRKFAELLNYATLPFYWPSFEPERGKPRYEYMDKVSDWCNRNSIDCKGHPLVWNYSAPRWLPNDLDEIKRLSDERVSEIVYRYQGKIDIWDVVNEATDPWRFDNLITQVWRKYGQMPFTVEPFKIARQSNRKATLLINDYRTDPEYEKVIEQLLDENGKPLYDVIGIQSHMHGGVWQTEKIWEVCDRFSRFGVPLHFTETTIVSGPRTAAGWGGTNDAGEADQAAEVERFYTVLFSHPAVEAITWWDFSDRNAWQGAPAGFLRKDMSPKPAYERLMDLIKGEWWTEAEGQTDGNGELRLKGFYGRYEIEAKHPQKGAVSAEFHLKRGEENLWELSIADRF